MWTPTKTKKYGVAVHNWRGDVRYGLPLEIGETVQILEECSGWYRGFSTKNRSIKGIFPATYVFLKPCKVDNEGLFESVVPLEDPVVREVTLVLQEWGVIWKRLYVERETYKFSTLRKVMRELLDWRRQLLTGTLTQDHTRELKLKITSKIDWGNRTQFVPPGTYFTHTTTANLSENYGSVVVPDSRDLVEGENLVSLTMLQPVPPEDKIPPESSSTHHPDIGLSPNRVPVISDQSDCHKKVKQDNIIIQTQASSSSWKNSNEIPSSDLCELYGSDYSNVSGIEPLDQISVENDKLQMNYDYFPSSFVKEHSLTGRRIFDVNHLFNEIRRMSRHNKALDCSFENMKLINEERKGMESVYYFQCSMCGVKDKLVSENPNKKCMDINSAWVSSMLLTGQSFTQMKEITSSLDMPCCSKDKYYKCERQLQSVIHDVAWLQMEEAAKEEARLAVAAGSVDAEGIPLITVITDGAWCKRSYGNYNAMSGVACIIGALTNKVIFISVRNSYCCICTRAESKGIPVSDHVCYKNWNKSATAMESDIIVEGFKCSVAMHGVKYHQLIGDGDSSVMRQLEKAKPYGHTFVIQKIECVNHILRNYLRRLRDIATKTKNTCGNVPIVIRKALSNRLVRLRYAITCAIKYRKSQRGITEQERVKELRSDIHNGPFHVFGDHSKCSEREYYCDGSRSTEENIVPSMKSMGIWDEIMSANNMVVHHAESLLKNMTTNRAESFNNTVAKFVSGKRVNFSLRGGYLTRSELSVISCNADGNEQAEIHKKFTNHSPGEYSKKYLKAKKKSAEKRKKRRLENPTKKTKKKINFSEDSHYGNVSQIPDMNPEEYEKKKEEFLRGLQCDSKKIQDIQSSTTGQRHCILWKCERAKRLTASNFGKICRMRETTPRSKTVQSILYSTFSGNKATKYGIENEPHAVTQLEQELGLVIIPSGLFIDENIQFLAASPDGLIGSDGIIEIKCPATAKTMLPEMAILEKKINFCELKDGKMHLKIGHMYMYQIQGQLHITGRQFCLFVVWTPKGMLFQKITKDDNFWKSLMEEKLIQFYMNSLLPELVDPRYTRNLPIRENLSK